MYQLVEGKWVGTEYAPRAEDGEFVRAESTFRDWVTADGSSDFKAEPGRYHLYVCLACPWAHRTLIFRSLKGLEDVISVSVVHPHMAEDGWVFADGDGYTVDAVNGFREMYRIYTLARPDFTGIVTVPVLWDRRERTIVNNESSDIIRMLNSAFDQWGRADLDYYPRELRSRIDAVNAFVYENVNNGVYRVGFARTQEAYEAAYDRLFAALDELEDRLGQRTFLVGTALTEADWRLFTTLVRFDTVYYSHFKCNRRRLVDYPNLWAHTRTLYRFPGIAATVNFAHIKEHYYRSHPGLNPSGIVPKGPEIDFDALLT
jgi:glutathionyl-hydroquinone reductase